jgi:hypothetical protein
MQHICESVSGLAKRDYCRKSWEIHPIYLHGVDEPKGKCVSLIRFWYMTVDSATTASQRGASYYSVAN